MAPPKSAIRSANPGAGPKTRGPARTLGHASGLAPKSQLVFEVRLLRERGHQPDAKAGAEVTLNVALLALQPALLLLPWLPSPPRLLLRGLGPPALEPHGGCGARKSQQ